MRVSVARRNLFSDRTRLAISVGGVAVAILLILTLLGVYKGLIDVSTAYIDHVDADLWAAQAGSRSMSHSYSLISASLEKELDSTEGVAEVHPIVIRPTMVEIGGKENTLRIIGYHPDTGIGGPWKLGEGRGDPRPGEIVADSVFMRTNDLEPGNEIRVEDRSFRIVGVSQETNVLIFNYAFADIEEIRGFLGPDLVNYLVIKVADGESIADVEARIEAEHPELTVFTTKQFADINASEIKEGFVPILAVLVVIAFLVGMAIVGLVVYSATVERSREYGILKAMGASPRTLYGIVFEQSLLGGFMGFVLGSLLAFVVVAIVQNTVPQVTIIFAWTHFLAAFLAAAAMSIMASYVPIRKINSIDPAIVFKA